MPILPEKKEPTGLSRENPLLHQETKTKALEEGANVTVELNEAGAVIDLHRAGEHSPVKK